MRIDRWSRLVLSLLCMVTARGAGAETSVTDHPGFEEGCSGFTIEVRDLKSAYHVIGVCVLPEEGLRIAISESDREGSFVLMSQLGRVDSLSEYVWQWQAPREPGLCHLAIRRNAPADSILVNVFVMVPASAVKGGRLGTYRIGEYPKEAYKGLDNYRPPKGFVKVTRANQGTLLSPHFRLEQFLCKQKGEFPKYIILREELVLKLELILHEMNQRGYPCSGFHIMSGYRTPYYNKSIGNVKYSRHQWGGAADIFIDENPADEMMDDLNGDGAINWRDAEILYDIVDDLYGKPKYEPFIGGLARYRTTANHGPFVHIDVRGFRARWGD